jgi:putative transposase
MVKYPNKKIRLMFQDEARFGRINKLRACWSKKGKRPVISCHFVREYRYAFGAVEPRTGDSCFLVLSHCNTICMNVFLEELSKKYIDDIILLACDNAGWHKSLALETPENIVIIHIPPCTPEMNPIEQIWDELREKGFANQIFKTLDKVVDRLCDTIKNLTRDTITSITYRPWLMELFI